MRVSLYLSIVSPSIVHAVVVLGLHDSPRTVLLTVASTVLTVLSPAKSAFVARLLLTAREVVLTVVMRDLQASRRALQTLEQLALTALYILLRALS